MFHRARIRAIVPSAYMAAIAWRMRASRGSLLRTAIAVALGSELAELLWQHRRTSLFQGDDKFVFCSSTGGKFVASTTATVSTRSSGPGSATTCGRFTTCATRA
jgi:hypothetical protein